MNDTLDWLETIGQDASLRHADAGELTGMLEAAEASEALLAAIASGDSAWLSQEFGCKAMFGSQSSQSTHEDEELPGREDGDEPGESEPDPNALPD